jgi:hypothetical protein
MDIFEADYSGHNRKPKTDAERAEQLDTLATPDTVTALAQLEAQLGVDEVAKLAADRDISRHELARRVARDGLPLSIGGE